MQLSRRCYRRWIARMSGEATAPAMASNNRLIAHETRVAGRRDTESRSYFAMPYRPRQRANPFSLMNHETRQRHRNTLKGEMHRVFFCCFLSPSLPLRPPILLPPNPSTPIHLSSSFIILLRRRRPPRRTSFLFHPHHDALTLQTPAPVQGNASFLKMILADRARHLFRIPPYLVHCTSQEQKVT